MRTVITLLESFRNGNLTPAEALEYSFGQIERINPSVNAFTALDTEHAIEQANFATLAYQAGTARALEGVPVAVKEIFAVEGMPFTAQSLTREGFVATNDAPVVSQLRELGAVIVGMTRTQELAWGITTQHKVLGGVANPHDLKRVAGGSSSGSAAAVATDCVPIALGSDTACSVRLPAACCGVFGYKPTHATLSAEGVLPLAPTLDTVGLIANNAADVAYVMNALGSFEEANFNGTTIGICRLEDDLLIEDSQRVAIDNAVEAIRGLGYETVDVEFPHQLDVSKVFATLQASEALNTHAEVLKSWPGQSELYGHDVRTRLEFAESVTDVDRESARRQLVELVVQWNAALDAVDAVLLPAMMSKPSLIADADNVDVGGVSIPWRDAVIPWMCSANMLGIPACAIPVGPEYFQSVQLYAPRYRDAKLLALCYELSRVLPRQ